MGEPVRVVFTTGFSRRYTGGVREFEIEARNLRHVMSIGGLARINSALRQQFLYFLPLPQGQESFRPTFMSHPG